MTADGNSSDRTDNGPDRLPGIHLVMEGEEWSVLSGLPMPPGARPAAADGRGAARQEPGVAEPEPPSLKFEDWIGRTFDD